MDVPQAGQLLALAAVDSTSIGTLVIPILLLLLPGNLRFDRYGFYLVIVAGLYFVIGIAIALTAGTVAGAVDDRLSSRAPLILQAALGLGLLLAAYWFYQEHKRRVAAGVVSDWSERVSRALSSRRNLALLATGAVATELVTMLPYLAAIGLIVRSELSVAMSVATLAVYVVVMVLPALLIFAGYRYFCPWIAPYLQRLSDWIARTTYDTLSWISGIAGFYIASNALGRLL